MKQVTLKIQFDAEKFRALKYFADKKGVDIDKELATLADKLYSQYVSADLREYIASRSEDEK